MKLFFKYLLQKPPIYIQVWAYIYANTDENGKFEMSIPIFLSKFKTPKSTLHRILTFGKEWNNNGTIVEQTWNNNLLKITMLEGVRGTSVERKWNKRGTKSAPKKETESNVNDVVVNDADYQPKTTLKQQSESEKLYPKMIKVYDEFCLKRIGVGAKMDGLQGKSMKNIISFLSIQVKNKKGESISEEDMNVGIVSAWEYILTNWELVKGYYAEQIKLNQINANLPNILMQLKTNKSNPRDAKYSTIQNEIGNISFE